MNRTAPAANATIPALRRQYRQNMNGAVGGSGLRAEKAWRWRAANGIENEEA